jgi:hypothetical protein
MKRKCKRKDKVIGIHLIEKEGYKLSTLLDNTKKIWATAGYSNGTTISLKRAEELKGCPIWLHKAKKLPSHLGGIVLDYKTDEWNQIQLIFVEKKDCIGSLASVSWGHNTRVYIFGERPLKEEFEEGRTLLSLHKKTERNRELIKLVKIAKQNIRGNLSCEVCGFCFSEKYGDRGDGYIEAHHIIPFRQLKGYRISTVDDFALVCSNCHRMLHRTPDIAIEELTRIYNTQNGQSFH